jgi:hypothetical protein
MGDSAGQKPASGLLKKVAEKLEILPHPHGPDQNTYLVLDDFGSLGRACCIE